MSNGQPKKAKPTSKLRKIYGLFLIYTVFFGTTILTATLVERISPGGGTVITPLSFQKSLSDYIDFIESVFRLANFIRAISLGEGKILDSVTFNTTRSRLFSSETIISDNINIPNYPFPLASLNFSDNVVVS